MDSTVLPPKLLSRLSAAADKVRSHDFIQVFSHHDSDGLSAAGILANTLMREKKEFQVTILPMLTEETFEKIKNCDAKCIIVSDMGAYYIRELEAIEGKDIIVLDHHTAKEDSEKIIYANPLLFGVDGMSNACGATMCLLFSVQMNEKNWDLVQIAFAGITGDKQTLKGVKDFNKYLLDNAVERGFIKEMNGSIIPPGVLSQSLLRCTEPYFSGITGNVDGVKNILSDAGIAMDKRSDDLTDAERRKLSSLLVTRLAGTNMTVANMNECMHPRYHLVGWNMDSQLLADLLDSCGRSENPSVGISLCLGSQDDLLRAMDFKKDIDDGIIQSVLELDKSKPKELDHIQYFYAGEMGSTSAICSIAMKCIGVPGKPMIGLHKKESLTKASARGTFEQLDNGINLAIAMDEAAKSVGGEGGGHRIASGAALRPGTEDDFLKKLDEIIGGQVSAR